jgi:hypothetical protein
VDVHLQGQVQNGCTTLQLHRLSYHNPDKGFDIVTKEPEGLRDLKYIHQNFGIDRIETRYLDNVIESI